MDTINNCLRAVEERANILVLVVGGRYGYVTDHGEKSVTNLEYLRAKVKGIPIFVFIDQSVLNILPVWEKNKTADFSGIVDSPKIFELAVEKPDGWEYLLFAAALKDNLDKLDELRYDLKYGITFKNAILYNDPTDIIDFVK